MPSKFPKVSTEAVIDKPGSLIWRTICIDQADKLKYRCRRALPLQWAMLYQRISGIAKARRNTALKTREPLAFALLAAPRRTEETSQSIPARPDARSPFHPIRQTPILALVEPRRLCRFADTGALRHRRRLPFQTLLRQNGSHRAKIEP